MSDNFFETQYMSQLKAKLHSKITQITAAIGKVDQDGKNTFSNYTYISSDQLMAALRGKLAEFHVNVAQEIIEHETKEFRGKENKMTFRTRVKIAFEVVDTETGYSEFYDWYGVDQDTGGKDYQQAVTSCVKYFMFKLFKVSSKEETDPDSKDKEIQTESDDEKAEREQKEAEVDSKKKAEKEEFEVIKNMLHFLSEENLLNEEEREGLNAKRSKKNLTEWHDKITARLNPLYEEAHVIFEELPIEMKEGGEEHKGKYSLINFIQKMSEEADKDGKEE